MSECRLWLGFGIFLLVCVGASLYYPVIESNLRKEYVREMVSICKDNMLRTDEFFICLEVLRGD